MKFQTLHRNVSETHLVKLTQTPNNFYNNHLCIRCGLPLQKWTL